MALVTFLPREATAAPRGRKQPRLGSPGTGSGGHLRPPDPRRPPAPFPLHPSPACRVGAWPLACARVRARVCVVCARAGPASDPRPRPAQDRPGIPARAPRPTSPAAAAAGPPAVHPGAPCKKMAGSVADSDTAVVSAEGCTRGAPLPRPRTPPPAQPGCGVDEAEAQPGAPRVGRRPVPVSERRL